MALSSFITTLLMASTPAEQVRFMIDFPKLKDITKRTVFEGVEAIKRAVMTKLWGIPVDSSQQWIKA